MTETKPRRQKRQSRAAAPAAWPEKKTQSLSRRVARAVLSSAVADGHLVIDGKDDDEIQEAVYRYLQRIVDRKVELVPVIDYRDMLLREARAFVRQSSWPFAALFYATYFEHVMNALIARQAKRLKLPNDASVDMIRETSFRGKTGWLPAVLGMQALRPAHRKKMIEVSEIRNAFVHYKWKPKESGAPDPAERALRLCPRPWCRF